MTDAQLTLIEKIAAATDSDTGFKVQRLIVALAKMVEVHPETEWRGVPEFGGVVTNSPKNVALNASIKALSLE